MPGETNQNLTAALGRSGSRGRTASWCRPPARTVGGSGSVWGRRRRRPSAAAGPTRGVAVPCHALLSASSKWPFPGNARVPTSVRRFLRSAAGAPRIYPEPRAAAESLSPRSHEARPHIRGQSAVWGPLGRDHGPGFVGGDTFFVATHSS